MLTIKVQKNMQAAKRYFDEHLAVDGMDASGYYSSEDGPEGESLEPKGGAWQGKMAKRLGLNDRVTKSQFDSLLEGFIPGTETPLTKRRNKNGERRLYFDCVFSAPKSVSVMALAMEDQRLIHAHNEAVRLAFEEMEKEAHTRVRKNGAYSVRPTGELLASEFLHSTSRSLDPQLHSHMVVFNVTYDNEENQFKALEAYGIYDQARYLTEVYRSILHKKVMELGFKTRIARHGFEIEGVSQEILDLYSKRSQDIKLMVQRLEEELGRKLSNNELSHISHQTRDSKDKSLSPAEMKDLWMEQLSETDHKKLINLKENSFKKTIQFDFDESIALKSASKCIDNACKHLFERRSVVKIHEVLEVALKEYSTDFDFKFLKEELHKREDLIFDFYSHKVGSKELLGKEWFISESVKASKSKELNQKLIKLKPLEELNSEQTIAFQEMISNRDKYFGLIGAAGAGKSRLLKSYINYEEKRPGRKIIATGTTTKAREALVEDYGIEAMTFQKLVFDEEKAMESMKNTTLIVDEAGLLSVPQMEKLMKISNKTPGSRVLFVGDTRQHHSVEAGDALRAIIQYGELSHSKLTQVQRQYQNLDYLEAAQLVSTDGKIKEAWNKLEEMNVIHEASSFKDRKEILNREILKAKDEGLSTICMAPTWNDIDDLTESLRSQMKERGDLKGKERTFKVHRDLSYSAQEKLSIKSYVTQADLEIKFNSDCGEFEKGAKYRPEVRENRLYFLDIENNKKHRVDLSTLIPGSFSVGEYRSLSLMVGDSILIKENKTLSNESFVNGDTAKIVDIYNDEIVLNDGRLLNPKELSRVEHGYFMTTQLAQGLSTDVAFLHMTQNSGPAMNARFFHVGITRGRKNVCIVTDDKVETARKVAELENRDLVLDMLGKIEARKEPSVLNRPKTMSQEICKSLYSDGLDFNIEIVDLEPKKEIQFDGPSFGF